MPELSAPEFVDHWRKMRGRTMRVLRCVPPGDLEWAHAPGRFTFGDLARHLAGIERWMYAENAARRPSRYSGHGREQADGFDAVLAYVERLHVESVAIFSSLSAADLEARCVTPAGVPIPTWKWLRAMVEHEAHHRGQIHLMLGMRGVTAPPLFGLTEEEVAARSVRS